MTAANAERGDRIRVGIKYSGQGCTVEMVRAVWSATDEGGFDNLWGVDHYASSGPGGEDQPIFEGWSLLAAMAVATRRVRIGLNVTGNTYRNPAQLAKMATTVDHLSGGRLEFGIGAAWAENEHRMYGFAGLDHRVGRLSESLRILTALWTQERVSFAGRYYTLHEATANPKPMQRPYPPIWIGAGGAMTMKLTARYADVWSPSGPYRGSPEQVQRGSAELDRLCVSIGRDPSTIRRTENVRFDGTSPDRLVEAIGRLREVGVQDILVLVGGTHAASHVEQVARMLPAVHAMS
jgi:probable F420-dependent oxidoreductase